MPNPREKPTSDGFHRTDSASARRRSRTTSKRDAVGVVSRVASYRPSTSATADCPEYGWEPDEARSDATYAGRQAAAHTRETGHRACVTSESLRVCYREEA